MRQFKLLGKQEKSLKRDKERKTTATAAAPSCRQKNRYRETNQRKTSFAFGDVVVAQWVERLLAIPEVRVANPVIGKINIEHLFTVNCIEKT